MDYIIILMTGALISTTLSSRKSISFFCVCFKIKYFGFIIDYCLTPTITVFLLYRGVVYN